MLYTVEDELLVKKIAILLGTARIEKDLTMRQLSEITGVKTHSIHAMENRKVKRPNFLLVLKLALALNIDFEELCGLKKVTDIPLKERLSIDKVDDLKYKLWCIQNDYDFGLYKHLNRYSNRVSITGTEKEHYDAANKRMNKKFIYLMTAITEFKSRDKPIDDLIHYSFNDCIDTFYSPK